ncbi:sigma-70 family RNA polymerase sigma factor [Nocardia higoensis]|uniref:Sigma-70 family RNA polymerase sigma factor n=1 Tax=Nocardia higoensis TaxID=228599 RepID=A0ABS0DBL4_9NOCA|nr:sigma-70 family RNA polymerase sigma factor [Nocardia higoensis]MBF6355860.1 sigma-70 family RNA polymerase sigma factor [Nocardia higoensis]
MDVDSAGGPVTFESDRGDHADQESTASALVGMAVDGDEDAWELIVTQHTRYLGSIGTAKRLSSEECSDAVQETWLSAVAQLPKLRDPSRLRPWLAMIMRRNCESISLRRNTRREELVGDVADTVGEWLRDDRVDIERDILATERTSVLHQVLRLLPEAERVLLTELARNDGSYSEIAGHLGIPVGSIGPTRMRALRRLREMFDHTPTGDVLQFA